MIKLTEIFRIFFQIGAFTIGGGYAMLTMVERAIVDKRHYIEKDEFWELIAIVQTLPGVFAINTALYVGNRLRGKRGAVVAALGAAMPSFIAIILIAMFFAEFNQYPIVERIFSGLRPCVAALILVPACRLIADYKHTWRTIWIPFLAAFAIWYFKISPIWIILLTIVIALGLAVYTYRKCDNSDSDKQV